MGTCTTFSTTALLARTEKGVTHHGGTKVKNGALAMAHTANVTNKRHFCAISEPNLA